MKKIKLKYIIIEYPNKMLEELKEFIANLEKETERIVNFFGITNFEEKVKIKIWDNLNEFRAFAKENNFFIDNNGNVMEWLCGITYKNNINTLTLEEYRKTKGHENGNLNDIIYLILHEFVHACHDKLTNNKKIYKWLADGLATTISNQYNDRELSFNATLEEIQNGNIDYINYHTMFVYVYKTYGKNYIITLINNYELQEKETPKLYYETRKYIDILNGFIKKFPIPKGDKKEPYIILFDAYTGMGKSTVSKSISNLDNSIIINNDEIRHFLNDYQDETNLKTILQKYRLEELLKNNNSCILDSCFCHNYKNKLEYYKSIGIKYYIIKLECSNETIKKRLKKRIYNDDNYSIANYDDYLWMKNSVERVPIELVDFIINTEEDIDAQVTEFLNKYKLIKGVHINK